MKKPPFNLADFVPYLLNRAGVKIGLSFARDVAHLDITLPMWRVMAVLWGQDNQRLSDIAERTSIDISTLSRLLVSLEKKKLVARNRSGSDGRALSVSLSEKGRVMTERVIPVASHYEEVAIRGISESDLRRLKRMLTRMYANMDTFDEEYAQRQRQKPAKKRTSR